MQAKTKRPWESRRLQNPSDVRRSLKTIRSPPIKTTTPENVPYRTVLRVRILAKYCTVTAERGLVRALVKDGMVGPSMMVQCGRRQWRCGRRRWRWYPQGQ